MFTKFLLGVLVNDPDKRRLQARFPDCEFWEIFFVGENLEYTRDGSVRAAVFGVADWYFETRCDIIRHSCSWYPSHDGLDLDEILAIIACEVYFI